MCAGFSVSTGWCSNAVSLPACAPLFYVLSAVWKSTSDIHCICERGLYSFARAQLICGSVSLSGALDGCRLLAQRRQTDSFSELLLRKWLICRHNYVDFVGMKFISSLLFFFLPRAYLVVLCAAILFST